MNTSVNRRAFLAGAVGAATLAAMSRPGMAVPAKQGPWISVFSKHLQFLDYKQLAKTCRELGLDGVDLTVRDKGHVLPKNVARDLPAAVEALRAEGLDVPMITTALNSGDDPDARPILEAASKLGIPYFRIGGLTYDANGEILAQLARYTEQLRGLAKLAEELNLSAGYHNHSGTGQVGGPVWDLHRMIEAIQSPRFGSNYDIGHAKVEGAFGDWQITARLMAPHVKMMAVKDFVWEKDKPKWVPLGSGVVQFPEVFRIMRASGFAGPVSIHVEYKTANDDALLEDLRKAAVTLRGYLKDAGYA